MSPASTAEPNRRGEPELPPELGTVVTFYSYKGGVGRSMALANVAALLAREGRRVLVIDWDLEAPGIDKYLQEAEPRGSSVGSAAGLARDARSRKPGLVDLIVAWRDATAGSDSAGAAHRLYGAPKLAPELDWRPCMLECRPFADGELVRVITAGRAGPAYISNVQGLDWNELFKQHEIGLYFERLRDEWRAEFDFVLIDSRTGLSDTGSICTSLLPDQLVVFFTANEQSVEGVLTAVRGARAAQAALAVPRSGLPVVPVPARDEPYNEKKLSDQWRATYAEKFAELYEEWALREPDRPDGPAQPVPPATVLNSIFIPYASYWSFGERLPVLEDAERENPAKIGAALARLARLIDSGLKWSAVSGEGAPTDLERARAQAARAQEEAQAIGAELRRKNVRRWRWIGGAAGLVALITAFAVFDQWSDLKKERRLQDVLESLDAEPAYDPERAKRSLDELKSLVKRDDPRLLAPTLKVASLFARVELYDEAIRLYREARDLARDELESEFLTEQLADVYEDSGRSKEAEDIWHSLTASRCERLGETSEACINTRTHFALFLARADRFDDAVEQLSRVFRATDQAGVFDQPPQVNLQAALRSTALQNALSAYVTILRFSFSDSNIQIANTIESQLSRLQSLSGSEQRRDK